MGDLATALQQVLRQVREETWHNEACNMIHHLPRRFVDRWQTTDGVYWDAACTCDFGERVETEQARRCTLLIEPTGPFVAPDWIGDEFLKRWDRRLQEKMAAREAGGQHNGPETMAELIVEWWETEGRAKWLVGAAQQERGSA